MELIYFFFSEDSTFFFPQRKVRRVRWCRWQSEQCWFSLFCKKTPTSSLNNDCHPVLLLATGCSQPDHQLPGWSLWPKSGHLYLTEHSDWFKGKHLMQSEPMRSNLRITWSFLEGDAFFSIWLELGIMWTAGKIVCLRRTQHRGNQSREVEREKSSTGNIV